MRATLRVPGRKAWYLYFNKLRCPSFYLEGTLHLVLCWKSGPDTLNSSGPDSILVSTPNGSLIRRLTDSLICKAILLGRIRILFLSRRSDPDPENVHPDPQACSGGRKIERNPPP